MKKFIKERLNKREMEVFDHICIYISIYIYIERERERMIKGKGTESERKRVKNMVLNLPSQ